MRAFNSKSTKQSCSRKAVTKWRPFKRNFLTWTTDFGKLRSSSSVIWVRYVGLSNTGGLSLTSFTCITTVVWFSLKLSEADKRNSYFERKKSEIIIIYKFEKIFGKRMASSMKILMKNKKKNDSRIFFKRFENYFQ